MGELRFMVKAPASTKSTLSITSNSTYSDPALQLNADIPETRAAGTKANALCRERECPPLVWTLTM